MKTYMEKQCSKLQKEIFYVSFYMTFKIIKQDT